MSVLHLLMSLLNIISAVVTHSKYLFPQCIAVKALPWRSDTPPTRLLVGSLDRIPFQTCVQTGIDSVGLDRVFHPLAATQGQIQATDPIEIQLIPVSENYESTRLDCRLHVGASLNTGLITS